MHLDLRLSNPLKGDFTGVEVNMKKRSLGWFLFGLGGQLQIAASLSFTELFVLMAAPLLYLQERVYMKRNGVMPFFYLSLALIAGCVVACLANHTAPTYSLRGMAVCCLLSCSIIVSHWMLRKDMTGLKWYFLGVAISGVLCTFVFQKAVEVVAQGGAAASDIAGGVNYWIQRIGPLVTLPAAGWYLSCPIAYSVGAPLFMAFFALFTSISGRGAAVRAMASAALVIIGGKKRSTLRNRICRGFWVIMILGIIGVFAAKQTYQIAATSGWLGEKALQKYEAQTKGRTGVLALIMGGRMDSFCGLIACVDKPIIGFGPWALDDKGYIEEFLARYADYEDYANYIKSINYARAHGLVFFNLIPCHAVVTELWLWYGISGLIFCLYVFFAVLRYLKEDCWAVPQWFFWIGASVPGLFFNMIFNPLSSRVGIPFVVVACLIVRAVRKGRLQMPNEMIVEIETAERK